MLLFFSKNIFLVVFQSKNLHFSVTPPRHPQHGLTLAAWTRLSCCSNKVVRKLVLGDKLKRTGSITANVLTEQFSKSRSRVHFWKNSLQHEITWQDYSLGQRLQMIQTQAMIWIQWKLRINVSTLLVRSLLNHVCHVSRVLVVFHYPGYVIRREKESGGSFRH